LSDKLNKNRVDIVLNKIDSVFSNRELLVVTRT